MGRTREVVGCVGRWEDLGSRDIAQCEREEDESVRNVLLGRSYAQRITSVQRKAGNGKQRVRTSAVRRRPRVNDSECTSEARSEEDTNKRSSLVLLQVGAEANEHGRSEDGGNDSAEDGQHALLLLVGPVGD